MFDLILRWFQPDPTPCAGPPVPVAVALADSEPILGCGWFDSSHDLVHGAQVVEVDDAATPLWRMEIVAQA